MAGVRGAAARAAGARDELDLALAELRDCIVAADSSGAGRNEIARAAEGGLSRKKVLATLAANDLATDARAALGGLPATVHRRGEHAYVGLSIAPIDAGQARRDAAAREVVEALAGARISLAAKNFDYALDDIASGVKFAEITRTPETT